MKNSITHTDRNRDWNPFLTLRREMDQLFDQFWRGEDMRHVSDRGGWQPACDIAEDQDHFLLSLEMAGVPKDQIKIEVLNNRLIVSGDRRHEEKRKENGVLYTERAYGQFQRSFALPEGLDTDKIEAHYEDGMLRVIVPKVEAAKPKQIKIGGGGSPKFFGKLLSGSKERTEETPSNKSGPEAAASSS